ncbi:rhomboid family intramembrane serine protease [Cytobacillus sp. Hz8]|uniref:rhomboid family intramembrane serine protease n=1 Tax=Cytobacillus sp. Hz8 TaxID=3347168 RepID=UPI0035DA94FF
MEWIQQKREFYRLISYAFIHGGFKHLFMNMVIILLFSPPLEKSLGKIRFMELFFFTTLGSALTILLPNSEAGVGSSGFEFGLFGIYLSMIILKKDVFDNQSKIVIIFFISSGWIITFLYKNISIAGHFGGFISGIIMGIIFICTNSFRPFNVQG